MGLVAQVFRTVGANSARNQNLRVPMLNSLTASYSSYLASIGQIRKKKALMAWYKGIPELNALVSKVARDITLRWHFEPLNLKKDSRLKDQGKNRILRANKFAASVEFRKILYSQAIDQLITGEAFGWKGKLPKREINKVIKSRTKKEIFLTNTEKKKLANYIYKELKFNPYIQDASGISEDVLAPRKYRSVPSSTIEIIHDQFDVLGYNHVVGVNNIEFSTDEIIHYDPLPIDGKVGGFTPVESVLVQLELLRLMWQNMKSIHHNGGVPDYLFVLKNIQPNSPSYKRIEQQLQKYKAVENKHGNLLFTGDVTVEALQQLDKMQFMDSGLYITGLLAMQWQIPRSSIPFILKESNTKDDTGGNSDKSYWETVYFFQENWAETMNTQLWIPHFGVRFVFDNAYINRNIQDETSKQLKYANVEQMDFILMKSKKKLSFEKRKELLRLTDDDIEEMSDEELNLVNGIMSPSSIGNQNQPSPKNALSSEQSKNKSDKKKDEQTAVMASRGKPNGVSKEFNVLYQEYKEIKESDSKRISIDKFVKLYHQDKINYGISPLRVFRESTGEFTSFSYKGKDFVYKTIISNDKLELHRVKVMNFDEVIDVSL